MKPIREGSSVSQASLLVGSSIYAYWEAHMTTFIMSVGEAAWEAIDESQAKLNVTRVGETSRPKEKAQYTTEESRVVFRNSKVLTVIFKGSLEILQNQHEGNAAVRMSKLQILTTRFENLKMNEEEQILNSMINCAIFLMRPFFLVNDSLR